ncbi:hypothetical protein FZC84_17430 [Rossellomorea vietnamensis]|uniref:Uncharacterized protein n=1 Tax=Rossellomorea vietnamensis TaxID=218284 RepID=A0A5D4M797_9BACI|nr:hypothetical protein [Rossellomorea vietnamensis]TYR97799.1 hypothetical protein FZC84_17430 [Rossellomorea vietnamensis]
MLKLRRATIRYLNLFLIVVITLLVTGCSSAATDNPTAKDILDDNRDADIIKMDDLIYSRSSGIENESSKGEKIGEIKKKTTNTLWFGHLYASKLTKGTEVFTTKEEGESGETPFVILVEIDGELYDYHALLEG